MKLSDTQLIILSAAARRDDHGIALPPTLKGGAAQKVVAKLLDNGLVEEVRARGALPVWRRDDESGARSLRITKRGLAAIQVEDEEPRSGRKPFVSTQSTQDDARRRSSSGIPICPGCRKTMLFKDKKHILFADALSDVTYRCETCSTETKRTVKDR